MRGIVKSPHIARNNIANDLHRFSDKLKIEALRAALKTSPTEVELPQKEKAFSVGFHFSERNTFSPDAAGLF
ncbi:hypothetical protein EDS67_24860 [candidate division KSB1 bacterium]|nr:MAG: hypothetical protein EDS67_24860 [candidate division KSB1 bacterium]MBC6949378.1 hypothetical protein [candidate division KSB1 bacterium]MCE7944856.1 hypothetical protein [Chlorobi bacterium CHB1]